MGIKIEKIEYYLPSFKLTSEDLIKEFNDFDISKVEDKIGIRSRQVAIKETSLDLAYNSSLKVIESTKDKNIDFILYCTQTPDYILPTSACILQDKLNLKTNIGALDFNLGCSGYVYGLALCKGLIDSGIAKRILFVTTDTYTKYIHKKDKGNRSIFGDGSTATILSYDNKKNIKEFELNTDGSGFDKLIIKNGGSKNSLDENPDLKMYGDNNYYNDNCLYMQGPDIFNFTIKNIPKLIKDVLNKNKMDMNEIDYFIFHQANKFMLNYLMKKIKIPQEKFHIDLTETGNTVSSTIPIALKQALDQNKIKVGDNVLLAGFGVGLSWGGTIITI